MNRWEGLALLLAVLAALALRLPKLETRPFHNDEAVNAIKVCDLWEGGRYAYDPDEYHGPTLHYATVPFLWLSDARNRDEVQDRTLRLPLVVFGIALIPLLLLLLDGLGRRGTFWAAAFTAVSPAMVFYSRYFIHEILLVFSTAITLAAGWRYSQRPSSGWAILVGVGVGLMLATKETFVISLFAMGMAAGASCWWNRTGKTAGKWFACWNWNHALLALLAIGIIWLVLFSSFFTHFAGLVDSVRTYLAWTERASGRSPHVHPWSFYLERLLWFHRAKGPVWSEGLILVLALFGAVQAFAGKGSSLGRFLAFYTLILTAIYSAIPYKTPWCLLSFWHGTILLAGLGAAAMLGLFRAVPWRICISATLLAFTLQLSWQAWRASIAYAADWRNPYVYAQTVPDLLNVVQKCHDLAKVAPAGFNTVIKVIVPESDYWPLPWYLRRFKQVGWYDSLPDDPFAPIVVASSRLDARLDDRSDRKWIMTGLAEMRPNRFLELYVEMELWRKYVETLPRERD